MKQLFIDIKTQLLAQVPELAFIQMYNNQFDLIEKQETYSFPFPCCFIEFVTETIQQLGNGVQIYDPLTVRVHIGNDFYNAIDGTQEQDLIVFELKQKIFKALNKFEPLGATVFIRFSETQDINHSNIYHFIQDYKTNYIDQDRSEPLNKTQINPPIELIINHTP
jgi:hypothetical protein